MPAPHLLVIDDEPHVSLVIQHACRSSGYRVSTARTLNEGREFIAADPDVDVLLLDVSLPDGSGLDYLAELRTSEETSDLPVIVLTGAGYDNVLEQAHALKALVVTKPFSPTKLRRMVTGIVDGLAKNA